MKKHILLFLILFPFAGFSQTFSTNAVVLIPDNGPEVYDTLVVSGLPSTIDSTFGLTGVCFDITHTWDADLQIRLKSPNGNTIFLANGVGGDGDDFTGTCLAENGSNGFLIHGIAPFTGIWIPLESLNQLNNGQDPNGIWLLAIEDVANNDVGDIHNFSLTFGSNPPPDPGAPPIICTFCDCPGGITPCDLLPDMTASALIISQDIHPVSHHSTKEIPGNLNLDNATPNIGWGPLEVIGADSCYCDTVPVPCTTSICPNGDPVKQVVRQIIYQKPDATDTLTSYSRTAGFMSYHPTHGHIHVDNWAEFSLRTSTSNPDATTWPVIGTGSKTSFCLINLGDCDAQPGYCVDTSGTTLTLATIPNAGLGFYSGCGPHQGIYTGSLDIYVASLNMGIDLTDICNGDYYIVSITDPDNNMLETNETNNWVVVPVTLYRQNPTAVFTSSINAMDATVNATGLVNNVTSYSWNFGDGSPVVSNTNPVTHQYTTSGNYVITLIVNSPCGAGVFTNTDTVQMGTVGITNPSSVSEFIHSIPNPAKEMLTINYNLNKTGDVTLELYDMLGKKIITLVNGTEIQGLHSINLNTKATGLTAGTYFLKLSTSENSYTKKIEIIN